MRGPVLLVCILSASVVTFLLAAKSHGRQVRLERERAGHMHVTFGKENHPFVEALWRRDRRAFWPTALVAAIAITLFWIFAPGLRPLGASPWAYAWLIWFGAMVLAFVAAGLTSFAIYCAGEIQGESLRNSILFWVATLVFFTGTLYAAWHY